MAYQSVNEQPLSAANRNLVYCYDDMPDAPHFLKLLTLRQVEVRVTIQSKVDCSGYEDNSAGRKRLAEDCYNRILGGVSKRDYAQEDEEGHRQTRMDGRDGDNLHGGTT